MDRGNYFKNKERWVTPEQFVKNKTSTKNSYKKHFLSKENRIKSIYKNRLYSAKKSNIEFTITFEEVEALVTDVCPVLGIKLDWENTGRTGKQGGRDNSPSIDKIDPNKGYVSGNVVWMSHRANKIKQDATSEEIQAVANWLKNK